MAYNHPIPVYSTTADRGAESNQGGQEKKKSGVANMILDKSRLVAPNRVVAVS